MLLQNAESDALQPISLGGGQAFEKQYGALAEVIRIMNELLGEGIDESHVLPLLQEWKRAY